MDLIHPLIRHLSEPYGNALTPLTLGLMAVSRSSISNVIIHNRQANDTRWDWAFKLELRLQILVIYLFLVPARFASSSG